MRREWLWCLLGALAGCITETGNPEFESRRELSAQARTSDPAEVSLGGSDGAGVTIDSASVTMKEVRLEAAERCDEGGAAEGEIEGPWTVDLLGVDDALPIELPDEGYCRLRLRLDPADGGPFDDRSIVISGQRSDGVRFQIESRRNEELEIRSRGEPFRLDPEGSGLLIGFDVASWLGDVGIASLEGDPILVSDDENRDALDRFEEAIERSLELFEDLDGDREIDDLERSLASGS